MRAWLFWKVIFKTWLLTSSGYQQELYRLSFRILFAFYLYRLIEIKTCRNNYFHGFIRYVIWIYWICDYSFIFDLQWWLNSAGWIYGIDEQLLPIKCGYKFVMHAIITFEPCYVSHKLYSTQQDLTENYLINDHNRLDIFVLSLSSLTIFSFLVYFPGYAILAVMNSTFSFTGLIILMEFNILCTV